MVLRTIQDMETLTGSLQEVINAAEDAGDRSTTNLLDDVIDSLEAHLWMLKAWEAK
jgi:DNA-binding ferritin-like protein